MAIFSIGPITVSGILGPSYSISASPAQTDVIGVDAAGDVVGVYRDETGLHAFMDIQGTVTTINVAGATKTVVTGVDAAGDAFGYYNDATGQHGFVDRQGTITAIDFPAYNTGLTFPTIVTGVDAAGDAFGYYISDTGRHGFSDIQGTLTAIDAGASGSETVVNGVDAAGDAFGTYFDNTGQHGFVDRQGTITAIDVAGASKTIVTGVDAAGDAFGNYVDAAGQHGFVDIQGTITAIDGAGAAATSVTGVDAAGDAFGYYADATGTNHGFVDRQGTITAIDVAGASQTYVTGIDAAGDVFGNYIDAAGTSTHGFVDRQGTITAIDVAGRSNLVVTGVDAAGDVVGNYIDNTRPGQYGFVDRQGTITTINVAGASKIIVNGVDAAGDAFGYYNDATGQHGFVDRQGTITAINFPAYNTGLTFPTIVTGVDAAGDAFGYYISDTGRRGFSDIQGTLTAIDAGASGSETVVNGVDAAGDAFGYYVDNAGTNHGFVDRQGTITAIDVAGASQTIVTGVDAAGDAFGNYVDAAGTNHGFSDIQGTITAIDGAGAFQTFVTGVDAAGDAFGHYVDAAGTNHGFVDRQGTITAIDVAGASQTFVTGVDAAGDAFGTYADSTGTHGFESFAVVAGSIIPLAPTMSDTSITTGSDGKRYVNAGHDTSGQALTGVAEAASTVNIYLNGFATPAYTTQADDSGAWSQTIGVLPDGAYSYVATVTDAAGDVSAPSAALAFSVDTTTNPPVVTSATLGAQNVVAIAGAAEANATVFIYANGGTTPIGQSSANANGVWSFITGGFTSAPDLRFVAEDVAGNWSQLSASGTIRFANTSYATVTGTAGADYIKVQSYGDTINGGGGNDVFEIDNTTAGWCNAISDAGQGKIVAGVNNAFIGLTNFNSATAGISTIDLNGKTGVVIAGSGSTLNLSGLTITDSSGSGQTATILASASYQTVTGTAGADYIKVQSYGDTINGGGGNDVFEIDNTTAGWCNAISDAGQGKIVAGVNNAFIGLTNFNSATAGISTIDLNGKTGVVIAGSGSTLNLSGLTITDSSGSGQTATILASASYQTVTGTAGADYIKVQSYGDTINGGGGNDVFEIDNTTAGWCNAISDAGQGKIVAGVNNAFIGLTNFNSATAGISTIDLNGKTGVVIAGSGSTLNLSGLTITDSSGSGQTATILASASYQTVTGTAGADYIKVQSYGDTINGGGGNDVFEIDNTTAGRCNAISDAGQGKIVAGVNNAFIGLTNFNSATAGISTIDLNGKTGVVIAGSGSTLNLSGLTITDSSGSGQTATILASASYQTVTGTAGADYIKVQSYGDTINGGGGNDVFDIKSGSNTLYGGAGNVRFLLDGTYGSDTIADFAASRDTIDITADAGHYDWNNLLSHATSSGANLILHTDISGDTVTLNGVLSGGQTASGYLTQNMSAFKLA